MYVGVFVCVSMCMNMYVCVCMCMRVCICVCPFVCACVVSFYGTILVYDECYGLG